MRHAGSDGPLAAGQPHDPGGCSGLVPGCSHLEKSPAPPYHSGQMEHRADCKHPQARVSGCRLTGSDVRHDTGNIRDESHMASPGRILLIEDDREISSTISGVLSAAGYDIITAPNGIEGRKLIEAEQPALVITDMMMPRMGGFPVLEFLRTLDSPPRVVMITANEGGRHKAYAEMRGVDAYLRKPFAMDVLIDTIERILSGEGAGTAAAKASPPKKRATRKKSSS